MKTELLGQEKNVVKIKVEFEAGEFTANFGKTLRTMAEKARIPGFRKGHVPRKMMEMRFGRGNLYNETLSQMIPAAVDQVVSDYDLETIAPPSLDVGEIHEGDPLTCTLTFELAPEVSLPEFQNIEVERLRTSVTDEMVENLLNNFRQKFSKLISVDRPAGNEDVVSVALAVRVLTPDGSEEKKEAPKDNLIDLGQPNVRSEIKNALLGKSKGDAASAEFEVEAEHEDKKLAGKRIRYDMTVNEVQGRILPEMGPEFYKLAMGGQIETEDAFRAELRNFLTQELSEANQEQATRKAIDRLMAEAELEVPETLVKLQIEYQKKRNEEDVQERLGFSMEDYLRGASVTPERYEEEMAKQAASVVRRTLVLDEVGKKFDVTVEKEDIDAEIIRLAKLYKIELAKMKALYYKNPDHLTRMATDLRYVKISRLIQEKVSFRDVDQLSTAAE
jgi:trigger factor